MRANMATELFEAGNPQHRLPPDVPLSDPDVEEQHLERQNTGALFVAIVVIVLAVGSMYLSSNP